MKNNNYSVQIKELELRFGNTEVLKSLNLDIYPGEFLVLLGSSGCGKSTLLNCIAGLLELSDGQIFINNRNVTWLEPAERGIGMVFQSYALYPRMSVEQNLSFGLRNSGMPKDEVNTRVAKAAEILQIQNLLPRRPGALSGGQRQRVAIGRALVREVDVFLFDEPLSNLDAKLRADLRVEIKKLHQQLKNTMIYVTHDQIEAMTLADRIAIMKNGKIMQLSPPEEIYNSPQNLYVAGFIGSPAMNFFEGVLKNGNTLLVDGTELPIKDYGFKEKPESSTEIVMGIRPEHFVIDEAATDSPLKAEITIDLVEPMGADTLIYANLYNKSARIRVSGYSKLKSGDKILLGFNQEKISLFKKDTGLRM